MKYWISLFIVLLTSCTVVPEGSKKVVLTDGFERIEIIAEIADEPQEQREGLMHRTELGEKHGMLFVFADEKTRSFWMKNTLIPLDILFFDADGNFVSVHTMEPCLPDEASAQAGEADPCPLYVSSGPATYALEVNAGFAEGEGVSEGWGIEIPE